MVENALVEKYNFKGKIPLKAKETLVQLLEVWGLNRNIIEHCKVVHGISMDITKKLRESNPKIEVDERVIAAGALVHDIGRIEAHGIEHGYLGGLLLARVNMDKRVVNCAKTHVLGGFTEEDIRSEFPPALKDEITGDLIPKTLEEKIICLADKHVIGTKKVTLEKRFSRWFRKYGRTAFLIRAMYRVLKIKEDIEALL
ncbi:MAG: HDIG domain-containing metalloprotein [Promethearchaeota archaeon]